MKQKGLFACREGADGHRILVAKDRRARAILDSLEINKALLCWTHTARYPEHHRFAFAVLAKIADAKGIPVEHVLLWIKRETGRFDWVRLPDGTTTLTPHSIAFESMSQEQFQDFWNDALVAIREQIIPNMPDSDYNEILDMLAGKVD